MRDRPRAGRSDGDLEIGTSQTLWSAGNSLTGMTDFRKKNAIDFVIVGPEQPLVAGIADHLRAEDIAVFGPSEAASQLEASKDFTKKLCDRYNIPTARYATFENPDAEINYVKKHGAPSGGKADGLAAGEGGTVAMTVEDESTAIEDCFEGGGG